MCVCEKQYGSYFLMCMPDDVCPSVFVCVCVGQCS